MLAGAGPPVAIVIASRGNPAKLISELSARFGPDRCFDLVTLGLTNEPESANAWVAVLSPQLLEKLRKINLPGLQTHVWLKPVH